jgi:N-acetylmuramoyl-L-alanine amidase
MPDPFTVVLDPGHGGRTLAERSTPNNAVGPNGLLEKDLTLKIARSAAQFGCMDGESEGSDIAGRAGTNGREGR